jgi:xanthine dehydrogenase accessory factor
VLRSDTPDAPDDPVASAPEVADVLRRGGNETAVLDVAGRRRLLAPLWPTPRLVIVGDGHIAVALDATARLMGWEPATVNDRDAAADAVRELGPGDGVIVLSHERPVDAPSLMAALAGRAGYVAALGSRHTQVARAQWLTEHGVVAAAQGRIHGPAGLDIGARTPQEVALAVVAEMVAVRAGTDGGLLSRRDGPIHRGAAMG